MNTGLNILLIAFLLFLNVADILTTNMALDEGGRELNPVEAWFQKILGGFWWLPKLALVMGLGIFTGIKIGWYCPAILDAVWLAVVIWNFKQLKLLPFILILSATITPAHAQEQQSEAQQTGAPFCLSLPDMEAKLKKDLGATARFTSRDFRGNIMAVYVNKDKYWLAVIIDPKDAEVKACIADYGVQWTGLDKKGKPITTEGR